jgi:hypothetical protein
MQWYRFLFQHPEHTRMRDAAGEAAAQRQPDSNRAATISATKPTACCAPA